MTKDLLAKVRELKELKVFIAGLEKQVESLENDIKSGMDADGVTELMVDVYVIRYTPVVSNKFDSARFKKDHADMYDAYTKQVSSHRFSIN